MAGERVELVLRVSDRTMSEALTLNLAGAPGEAELLDTDDGAYLFRWQTTTKDVGERLVTFSAASAGEAAGLVIGSVRLRLSEPEPEPEPEPADSVTLLDDGPPLAELARAHGLPVGTAVDHEMFEREDGERYRAILAEQYDALAPENSMKMSIVRPERHRFDWETADRIVAFAEEHGMSVHGHPLLWKQQIPAWARRTNRTEMAAVMREHITALVSRYRGRIDVWDVVNEALEEDGQPRHTLWYRGVGENYLSRAFHIAREHDPDAVLIYNDYGIGTERAKSDALHALLARELAAGTPIDGVGFQMHVETSFNRFDSLRRNLQRFADLGLRLYITELDVATDWREDAGREAEKQARVYAEVLRACLEQPACKRFQMWGLSDRRGWRGALDALPIDEHFVPKPAFHAMRRVLAETPVVDGR